MSSFHQRENSIKTSKTNNLSNNENVERVIGDPYKMESINEITFESEIDSVTGSKCESKGNTGYNAFLRANRLVSGNYKNENDLNNQPLKNKKNVILNKIII
jgi:hypothetical protein